MTLPTANELWGPPPPTEPFRRRRAAAEAALRDLEKAYREEGYSSHEECARDARLALGFHDPV